MMKHSLIRLALLTATLLGVGACTAASAPPVGGTFAGLASTPLPSPPLPAETLEIDATLRLDPAAGRFELDMGLEVATLMLSDEMNVRGTYGSANGLLTLTPQRFQIDPPSTNTMTEMTAMEPACITLEGFIGTVVCMPTDTSAYTLDGDELSFTLRHVIAGVEGTTPMILTRVP